MTKQILLQIIRSFSRNRASFLINIFGIIMGLLAMILATVIIIDEFRFDRFHQDNSKIYRVNKSFTEPSGLQSLIAETPELMAFALISDSPEIENATQFARFRQPDLIQSIISMMNSDNLIK